MNETNGFVKICKVGDLKESEGKRFIVDDVDVAVFKYFDKIYAMNNYCPHQLASVLYSGYIEDGFVTCPVHGWQFGLADGCIRGGVRGVDTYEVKVEKDDVFVKVFKREFSW